MSLQFGEVIMVTPRANMSQRECIISGTPVAGTCMTVLAATEPVAGIFTFEAFNRDADGDRAPVAVLLEDELQGAVVTLAYVAATQARLAFPHQGDLLQMLVANISGTPDAFTIGTYMIIEDGTGKLIRTTGSPQMESFVIMETVTPALTADTHVLCMYTGN